MAPTETLCEHADNDWWDDLPIELQASIEKSINESKEDIGAPHEEIVEKYSKWLKR